MTTITAELTKTASVTFATTDQAAGKAFTITDFMLHGLIKKVKLRADHNAGQLTDWSALINDGTGIAPGDTSIAYDNASGTLVANDYILIDNEVMKVTAVGPPLTVTRAQKGSAAAYHDDNVGIYKLNDGFTLQIYKDSAKEPKDMVLELAALLTGTGTTDAAITLGNKYIELSADIKNVQNNDVIRIADTVSEEALVQHNTGDVATAAYDYVVYVYDSLAAHDSGKTVEKVCVYDLPVSYKSTADTLYCTLQLMEASLASDVDVELEILIDKYD